MTICRSIVLSLPTILISRHARSQSINHSLFLFLSSRLSLTLGPMAELLVISWQNAASIQFYPLMVDAYPSVVGTNYFTVSTEPIWQLGLNQHFQLYAVERSYISKRVVRVTRSQVIMLCSWVNSKWQEIGEFMYLVVDDEYINASVWRDIWWAWPVKAFFGWFLKPSSAYTVRCFKYVWSGRYKLLSHAIKPAIISALQNKRKKIENGQEKNRKVIVHKEIIEKLGVNLRSQGT